MSAGSPKQSSLLLSHGQNRGVYFPSLKRTCVPTAFEQKQQPSIEILPDECLFEVFKHLSDGQGRSTCACVSKRWLTLLSSTPRDDTFASEPNGVDDEGYLIRCLFDSKATDVRLAAIAVGTANCGGLANLSIWGNNLRHGASDAGLKAIGRGCPTLKDLSLWRVSSIGDEGLSEIAHRCHLLEKLDLLLCPTITDKSLLDIARNCPHLNFLSIDNCPGVSNATIAVIGALCHNLIYLNLSELLGIADEGLFPLVMAPCCSSLVSLVIRNCPGVGNATIDVVGKMCPKLTHLELSGLHGITDEGLFPLVQSSLDNLVAVNLSGCVNITDKLVSCIVELHGGSLKSLIVDGCRHVTDATLVEISRSCRMLTKLDVSKCGITDLGIRTLASARQLHLRILSLSGCPLVSDNSLPFLDYLAQDLQSLNIQHCPRISSRTVDALEENYYICDILS